MHTARISRCIILQGELGIATIDQRLWGKPQWIQDLDSAHLSAGLGERHHTSRDIVKDIRQAVLQIAADHYSSGALLNGDSLKDLPDPIYPEDFQVITGELTFECRDPIFFGVHESQNPCGLRRGNNAEVKAMASTDLSSPVLPFVPIGDTQHHDRPYVLFRH